MGFEINLTPEDIDALVKDSIMKAGFGKAVEDAVKKVFTGYDNPIDAQLKKYVAEVAAQMIRERFADQIKAAVAQEIEARVTKDIVDIVVAASVSKMIHAAEERY